MVNTIVKSVLGGEIYTRVSNMLCIYFIYDH